MSYKPRTLFRMIEDIQSHTLLLPHIQRPFVWSVDQMQRLFDSLMRNYPIQTLLFWRTKDAIKARRFMSVVEWDPELSRFYDTHKSEEGVEKTFVLDGQQRLQTLYAMFAGAIHDKDDRTELHAWVDVTRGEQPGDDGLVYTLAFTDTSPGREWYRLADLVTKDRQRNSEEIADRVNDALDDALDDDGQARKDRQRRVRKCVAQMVSLLREEKHFWVEELDGVANQYSYERVLDIFVRVNSGGTKLDAADLMFAAMKEGWEEIEANIEEIVGMLNETSLAFDKSVVLKCLTVAHGAGAELTPKSFTSAQGKALLGRISDGWDHAENCFFQLRDFIKKDLRLYSNKVVRSYGSFVPLFDFLYHNPAPDERSIRRMKAYYYKAQIFNWFRSGTDALLNALHGIVGQPQPDGFPLREIKLQMTTRRRETVELTHEHMDMRLRFILLNLVYVEKHGSSPFDVRYKGNEPQVDHIYPQSGLRSQFDLTTDEINHLGNYRYVGATDNNRKRAEKPDSYFVRLKQHGVPIDRHLLLPAYSDAPSLLRWEEDAYREFRDRRFEAIFQIAKSVVDAELTEPKPE